jgi:hypothetical protein
MKSKIEKITKETGFNVGEQLNLEELKKFFSKKQLNHSQKFIAVRALIFKMN